ncbi:MAG: UDP-N-acetylglucosamine 2-epimerase (non-hydrolyzing) [Gammaproteobacteria bacterium]|jgi:UDP-N-acetylglucosamine 2-epimerase (non-hydrolysing)|nr:UDP-N-acetylglucosamine 2-epimerase (non-hydrolyzing) [Gammaproteobacteria bacterium]
MTPADAPARVVCVVGARPNFMKIAPILRALRARPQVFAPSLVHTGQHYDQAMKDAFFDQLGIPEPDVDLGVGSGSHAVQTAEVMKRFEPELDRLRPEVIVVVGDVNSTIACALVAVKKGVAVVHVEAGLRSFDRGMPEEINRVLTDQISDLLFTTEPDGERNLLREGIDPAKVHFVGNVMIDTLLMNRSRAAEPANVLPGLQNGAACLESPSGYGVLTLHRPSNVDDPATLRALLEVLTEVAASVPLVFPIHPRTRERIRAGGLGDLLRSPHFAVTEPVGYLELLGLMTRARLVLTDSGGIQEETTALGVPCITLRENTERPITVERGTNTVVGTDPEAIRRCVADVLETGGKRGRVPDLWDGRAAERIADVLQSWLGQRRVARRTAA